MTLQLVSEQYPYVGANCEREGNAQSALVAAKQGVDVDTREDIERAQQFAHEHGANFNLYQARGKVGVFAGDLSPDETIYVFVDSEHNLRLKDGKWVATPFSKVYFLSHWKKQKCLDYESPPERRQRRPFIPFSVLMRGEFDETKIPAFLDGEDRDLYVEDGRRIAAMAQAFYRKNPRRSRK